MILRILVFVLFGYILFKTLKFVLSVFKSINHQRAEEKVRQASDSKSKIDKEDIIDAQFEEIEDKKDQSSTNRV